jgi:hypothetical protein
MLQQSALPLQPIAVLLFFAVALYFLYRYPF